MTKPGSRYDSDGQGGIRAPVDGRYPMLPIVSDDEVGQ